MIKFLAGISLVSTIFLTWSKIYLNLVSAKKIKLEIKRSENKPDNQEKNKS